MSAFSVEVSEGILRVAIVMGSMISSCSLCWFCIRALLGVCVNRELIEFVTSVFFQFLSSGRESEIDESAWSEHS
jgi:hypothetical protein